MSGLKGKNKFLTVILEITCNDNLLCFAQTVQENVYRNSTES